MAERIKLFHSVQKFNQTLGIHPSRPDQRYSFNFSSAIVLLLIVLTFISSVAYFLYKAKTIEEHVQTFYISLTALCITIDFLTMCWKMTNILQLIEKYEEFIKKSKFTVIRHSQIYIQRNQ